MIECRVKLSLKFCNCVLPLYSKVTENDADLGFPYCGLSELPCLVRNAKNLTNVRDCEKCELSCQNIDYEIDKLSKSDVSEDSEGAGPYLNIEYLTWPIIRYKREVLFGWVDLLGELNYLTNSIGQRIILTFFQSLSEESLDFSWDSVCYLAWR